MRRRAALARLVLALALGAIGCAGPTRLTAPPPGSPAWALEPLPDSARTLTVFYATDRKPTGRSDPAKFFGGHWGDLSLGRCVVTVPRRKNGGLSGLGRWFRSAGTPVRGVQLRSLEPETSERFFAALQESRSKSPGHEVLLFVHGFNMHFERASRYLAQLARDIGFQGPTILYSWPAARGYMAAEENVAASELHLKTFVRQLEAGLGPGLHLMAYSMGNRALIAALAELSERRAPGDTRRFGQVVLVAPDLDARWFASVAPRVRDVSTRITLYASSGDKALRISRALHGHARTGGAHGSSPAVAGVEAIDVTRLRSEMFGHGYLDELARDLRAVMRDGRAPAERPWLEAAPDTSAGWWRLRR